MTNLCSLLLLALTPVPAVAQQQPGLIEPLRWEKPYFYHSVPNFIAVPRSVAIGDDGALTVVGRTGSDSGVDFHAGGSADPLLAHRYDEFSFFVRVDAADHAPVAAVFDLRDADPDPDVSLLVPRLELFEAGAGITPSWSWAFPGETHWYLDGGGVRVSDDGEVVVGWWDSFDLDLARVVALRRDGTLISQIDLPMTVSGYRTGGVRLSDDGSRALVPTVKTAMLLDVASGLVLDQHVTPTGTPLTGIALSGDGRRYATSTWNELAVFEQATDGTWTKILAFPQSGIDRFGPVALSQDGGRLAYTVQYQSWDGFDLVLLEVDTQTELFEVTQFEPASYQQLHAQDLALDDAGSLVACASLGDSEHTTPEVFVIDDTGRLQSSFRQEGSAIDVDLDPRGEVLAAGISPKHGTLAYVGGNMIQADPRGPLLRILGTPVLGGALEVTLAGGSGEGVALLLASPLLGASQTPFGTSALGLDGSSVRRLGPWPLVAGFAQQSIPIEDDASLAGLMLHYQGLIVGGDGGQLTNKVSVRLVP